MSIGQNSRLAEEELLVMDDTIFPTPEKYWFRAIHQPPFVLQDVDRIRPEMGDGFDYRLSTVDYSAMAAVIHGQ